MAVRAGADVTLPQGAALSGLIPGNCVAPQQGFGFVMGRNVPPGNRSIRDGGRGP